MSGHNIAVVVEIEQEQARTYTDTKHKIKRSK